MKLLNENAVSGVLDVRNGEDMNARTPGKTVEGHRIVGALRLCWRMLLSHRLSTLHLDPLNHSLLKDHFGQVELRMLVHDHEKH